MNKEEEEKGACVGGPVLLPKHCTVCVSFSLSERCVRDCHAHIHLAVSTDTRHTTLVNAATQA